MDTKTVGAFIAQLRKENNLTQKQLAEKLSVTDKAISRWETGKGYPDIEILASIAEEFHISLEELLSGRRLPPQEREIETQNQIVTAYKQAKKEKNRGRRWIIGLTVAVVSIAAIYTFVIYLFVSIFFINPNVQLQQSKMHSTALPAVVSEIDAMIRKTAEPSDKLLITDASMLVTMDGQAQNLTLFLSDPEKKINFQAHFDYNNGGMNLDVIVPKKPPQAFSAFLKKCFPKLKLEAEETVTPTLGIPYALCIEVLETIDFDVLFSQYVGDEFEKLSIDYAEKTAFPAEENTILGERPCILYESGALTEVKPKEIKGEYYCFHIIGMNNGQGTGEDSLNIIVPV